MWQGAARAINQRERLRMRYQRFDGVVRDYLLEPYHLAAYHGNWYLVALTKRRRLACGNLRPVPLPLTRRRRRALRTPSGV